MKLKKTATLGTKISKDVLLSLPEDQFHNLYLEVKDIIDHFKGKYDKNFLLGEFIRKDYLLKKCGENDKTKSLNLIFLINKIFEALINKELDLDGYKQLLKRLTLLLGKINYDELILENKIHENITSELEDFLNSI